MFFLLLLDVRFPLMVNLHKKQQQKKKQQQQQKKKKKKTMFVKDCMVFYKMTSRRWRSLSSGAS